MSCKDPKQGGALVLVTLMVWMASWFDEMECETSVQVMSYCDLNTEKDDVPVNEE